QAILRRRVAMIGERAKLRGAGLRVVRRDKRKRRRVLRLRRRRWRSDVLRRRWRGGFALVDEPTADQHPRGQSHGRRGDAEETAFAAPLAYARRLIERGLYRFA